MSMVSVSYFVFVVIYCGLASSRAQHFTQIGEALEGVALCGRNVYADRYIGRAPSKENYWNGTVNFDEFQETLTEARLGIELSAPAIITVNEDDGRIITDDKKFYITYFVKPEGYKRVKFHVQGLPFQGFPFLQNLTLNDVDICPKIREWEPTILGGDQNTGTVGGNDNKEPVETEIKCGEKVASGSWPWHAAIFIRKSPTILEYKCSGTLISVSDVLTSKKCVQELSNLIHAEKISVKLGQQNRMAGDEHSREFNVERIETKNDVVLLKLSRDALYSNFIRPACIWNNQSFSSNNSEEAKEVVVDWTISGEDDAVRGEEISRLPLEECGSNSTNTVCWQHAESAKCSNDYGGGVFVSYESVFYIRGIALPSENEDACEGTKKKYFFTDLSQYIDWIKSSIKTV